MLSNGYTNNDSDKYSYSKSIDTNTFVIICLYVDDMFIISSNIGTIDEIKEMLASNFDMKDMREANVILGINIIKTCDGLMLSQEHYIEKLLRTCMTVCTSYDSNTHLKRNVEHNVDQVR